MVLLRYHLLPGRPAGAGPSTSRRRRPPRLEPDPPGRRTRTGSL